MPYQSRFREELLDAYPELDEVSEMFATELTDLEWDEETSRRRPSSQPIRQRARVGQRPTPGRPPIRSGKRTPITGRPRPMRPVWRPSVIVQGPVSRLPTTPEPKPPIPEPAGPPSASPPSPDVAPSGETNEYIRWVQTSLNQILGLQLPVNGMMGVETRSAIRSFQEKNGLPADGMVGPDTERALLAARGGQANGAEPPSPEEFEAFVSELEDFEWEEEVNRSSREYAIWVQQSLNKILSLRLDVDGIIGTMTRAAIRDFQQQKGLIPDGIVGPMTEAALIKAGASAPPQGGTIPTPGTGGTSANINTQLPLSGPGFYSKYGNDPEGRAHQYGLPETIQALQAVGAAWYRAHPQGPRIGINHISLRGGGDTPYHATHENGLDVDIRPVTNNGVETGVDYKSSQYSRSLTQELVNLIRSNRVLKVRTILFNDPSVTGVSPSSGHDDHLHVSFLPPVPASGGGTAPPVAPQPYVPVQPATSGAALRNNIVTIAVKEWERWGKGTIAESDSRMWSVLEDYWRTGVGWVPSDPTWWSTWAWSAAFISWVMRKAGAGDAFKYSSLHTDYVAAAKRNRLENNSNPFKAYRITEVVPRVGDLVCLERSNSGVTYDNVDKGNYASHCDIVTTIQPGKLITTGGNLSNSVRQTTVTIDSSGRVIASGYYAVVRVGA